MDLVTKEDGKTTGFLVSTKRGEPAIQFRHAVFEVCVMLSNLSKYVHLHGLILEN